MRNKQRLLSALLVFLIVAFVAVSGYAMRNVFVHARQKEAENILYYYSRNIPAQLQGNLNEAKSLAQMAAVSRGDTAWFEKAASLLLLQEEVLYVCLVEGDTIVSALPHAEFGYREGRGLQDFSYVYTLAKVVKDLVVEGPVPLEDDSGRQVFLFLQPLLEGDAYRGEVAVALDCGYVLQQFDLDTLSTQGYDYELWHVNQEDGRKEVVAASRPGVDFSFAAKTTFETPSQWNLSVQPIGGWMSLFQKFLLALLCLLEGLLLLTLAHTLRKLFRQKNTLRMHTLTDVQTGLYNRRGFTLALDRWVQAGRPIMLFYLAFEGYNQVVQLIGPREENAFLQTISTRLSEYIRSPFLAGRLSAGSFALAIQDEMDESQREDFARGLSLELLFKVRLQGEKHFLTARYYATRYEPGSGAAEETVAALIQGYYTRLSQESPVRTLTEKCRQLIDGQSDVVFDEYTDLDMMELSKTFNQYRKQVEQLAYSDPMFKVGNRPKFVRDVNMLISYDRKRPFTLFCVDICGFSQYNDLFSAAVGDEILREVLHRLSRPFGTYLYRINGDVFLGVSLAGGSAEAFAAQLQQALTRPVSVGNTSFSLRVRIVVCRYPAHGRTPGALLDRVQAVLRFSKETNQQIVTYSDGLDKMLRTESDILHRLKAAIQENTLEIWYQPMLHLPSGRYTAAEALTRLPDGKGGYYPAGQVIALAERNGLVEQLGDYVLTHAGRYMQAHGAELGLEHIGVNISVQQLLVENSAEHLLHLIRSTGVDPHQVTLEITESVLIQSIDQAAATLDSLRQQGIRIALDDFGVGYSSLNYLSNLPVDVIKIDRSLTQQVFTKPKQYNLLCTIVRMAQINALTVVAEGVETRDERDMIAASGVPYIQGFYYARPLPETQLPHFLAEQDQPPRPTPPPPGSI